MDQRRRGRDAAPPRDQIRLAEPRRQLSRVPRLDRQLSREPRPADAALPARGSCGLDRPWLRQGDRRADGGHRPFQCRPDARVDGDVQRLVRPRAGLCDGCDRAGRRALAASLDRLDPYRQGPGHDAAEFRQVGRRTALRRGNRRNDASRRDHGADAAARTGLYLSRRGAPGDPAQRRRDDPGRRKVRGARDAARIDGRRVRGGGYADRRRAAGDDDRPGIAQPGRVGQSCAVGGIAGRARGHRPQDFGFLPDRASASRGTAVQLGARSRRGSGAERGCAPCARLDRPCRHLQGAGSRLRRGREGHRRDPRLLRSQRLVDGPLRIGGRRSAPARGPGRVRGPDSRRGRGKAGRKTEIRRWRSRAACRTGFQGSVFAYRTARHCRRAQPDQGRKKDHADPRAARLGGRFVPLLRTARLPRQRWRRGGSVRARAMRSAPDSR